jgi:hypothetical protein
MTIVTLSWAGKRQADVAVLFPHFHKRPCALTNPANAQADVIAVPLWGVNWPWESEMEGDPARDIIWFGEKSFSLWDSTRLGQKLPLPAVTWSRPQC